MQMVILGAVKVLDVRKPVEGSMLLSLVPFEQPPIAICTLQGNAKERENRSVSIINIAASQIICATTTPDAPEDAGFKFIALAHRQQAEDIGQGG